MASQPSAEGIDLTPLSQQEIREWRESLASPKKRGYTRTWATAHEKGLEYVESPDGDSGSFDDRPRVGHEDGRVTVKDITDMAMSWLLHDKVSFQMAKGMAMRRHPDWKWTSGDDSQLVRKYFAELAREKVEQVYKDKGWDRVLLPNIRTEDHGSD